MSDYSVFTHLSLYVNSSLFSILLAVTLAQYRNQHAPMVNKMLSYCRETVLQGGLLMAKIVIL